MSHALKLSIGIFLPAVIFYIFICIKDKGDRESFGLLAFLTAAGAAAAVPAFFGERLLQEAAGRLFHNYYELDVSGFAIFSSLRRELLFSLFSGFVCIAAVEIILKWLPLFLITKKNKEFTSFFDGLFYSADIAVGFCLAQSVLSAYYLGWNTLFNTVMQKLPEAMFTGIVMGMLYSFWHLYLSASAAEKKYAGENGIEIRKPFRYRIFLILSLLVPFVLRGFSAFADIFNRNGVNTAFYCVAAVVYISAFVVVFRLKKDENLEEEIFGRLISEKYKK